MITKHAFRKSPLRLLASLAAAIAFFATASVAFAQEDYKTPQDAVDALVATARSGDQKAALDVLGRDGQDIISSGDKVSDDAIRARFVASYDKKHQVAMSDEDKRATLVIGDNDYPFPIPIIRNKNSTWSWDTAAGREEILYRRIGHNELDAIQTCLAYVDAQDDYAAKDRGAGAGVYAQRFISTDGKTDGLYWPTTQGQEESPLGSLFATASAQGYHAGSGRSPYHGYYYKILTQQGRDAVGGAADYIVNGKMIGGFAMIAYPAEYRNSGVMTFIVNYSGAVFQKDLGPDTAKLAEAITSFNPDPTWTKVDVTEPPK